MSYSQLNKLPPQISIADYLFHRLKQLDITTIFGLPGEFNMPLLDKLYHIPGLRWAGNANELNAAYAADGYSRLKRLGCLVTTFGVGELSAVNGIAGSFAEHVGVVHIVGMPPTSARTKQLLLHHTLGNGDYDVFYRMANDITCYTTIITDSDLCAEEVDKCISLAWIKQTPAYMGIPVNQINLQVDSNRLDTPLSLNVDNTFLDVDNGIVEINHELEKEVTRAILKKIYKANNPAIIVDACVMRHDLLKETQQFCELTNFPIFVTPMGKGSIDEGLPNFGGVFTGSLSSPEVREVVDFADFVIVIGSVLSEFSTSSFHFYFKSKNCVFLFSDSVKFKNSTYPDLNIKPLLKRIIMHLETSKITYRLQKKPDIVIPTQQMSKDQLLRQEWVWKEFSHWFRPGDIIITEIGSSAFGIIQTKFPKDTRGISQAIWGAAGYSVGACLGASFAAQELEQEAIQNYDLNANNYNRRVILFVGDGAFQITMQEVSTMIRWNLKPYIFVMNNQGYSVDRFLHHRSNAQYYDIQPWHYLSLFSLFGASDYETRKVVTINDLLEMLKDSTFAINDKIRMLEIMVPSLDVPKAIVDKWLREKEDTNVINENDHVYSIENTASDGFSLTDSPLSELEPEQKRRRM